MTWPDFLHQKWIPLALTKDAAIQLFQASPKHRPGTNKIGICEFLIPYSHWADFRDRRKLQDSFITGHYPPVYTDVVEHVRYGVTSRDVDDDVEFHFADYDREWTHETCD